MHTIKVVPCAVGNVGKGYSHAEVLCCASRRALRLFEILLS